MSKTTERKRELKTMKRLIVTLVLASSTSLTALAKTPIGVSCTPQEGDYVGATFCDTLRDVVTASPRYSLLPAKHTSSGNWELIITTVLHDPDDSAQSVVLVWKKDDFPMYARSWVLNTKIFSDREAVAKLWGSVDEFIIATGVYVK
jgi:hypothetical protein